MKSSEHKSANISPPNYFLNLDICDMYEELFCELVAHDS